MGNERTWRSDACEVLTDSLRFWAGTGGAERGHRMEVKVYLIRFGRGPLAILLSLSGAPEC
jgi:hypothetical protein